MAEFYVTEERAMAPGIAGEWPKVIPKPDNPNGRLVKVDGVQQMMDGIQKLVDNYDCGGGEWWLGFAIAKEGLEKAKGSTQ